MREDPEQYCVYLCGPMANRSDSDIHNWRKTAAWLLKPYSVLDPTTRDYRGIDFDDQRLALLAAHIVIADQVDILNSAAVLVYYDKPSVGTSMEIMFAHSFNVPVFLVNASTSSVSPWLVYHCHKIIQPEYLQQGNLDHILTAALTQGCDLVREYIGDSANDDTIVKNTHNHKRFSRQREDTIRNHHFAISNLLK